MIGYAAMIQPQQVQDGSVQIGDHRAVFHGVVAQFVGAAVGLAAAYAAPGQPEAETLLMMVAAVAPLADWRAPEFSAPHHQHRVEQARSEEHTSELQSRRDLVCRLLLEKKK